MSDLNVKNETRIKQLRIDTNKSQAEVAEAAEVNLRTYQRWESGEVKNIRQRNANKLADFYNVPVGYLLGYDVPKKTIPYETYTPREYNAWEEFIELNLDKTELSFDIYEELRNNRNLNKAFLEIILNYSLSTSDDQKAIRQLAKTTAKANSGYSVGYKDNDE
ncbi:hypothetical protein BI362_07475 [Streptococcus parauberis]|nr:hypothetical protein BI362_07475 [Streptococcus parauberis]